MDPTNLRRGKANMTKANYADLGFFDCNAFIGRPAARGLLTGPTDPSTLLAEMDKVGVQHALVTHVQAREYHPSEGNRLLMAELTGHPRLFPCWTLLPHHTGEMPEPEVLVRQLLDAGVHAARVFPAVAGGWGHRFSLNKYVAGPLLKVLERHHIPLFVDWLLARRDDPPWRDVIELCENYPALPLVLVRVGGRSDRDVFPLLEAFPNLHIETGGYVAHRGLEGLVERYGAHRLLYGSGYPYYTLTGAAFRLAHTQLPVESRRLIAGDNLRRLLSGVITHART